MLHPRRLFFFAPLCFLLLTSPAAFAAPVDITADEISRTVDGVVLARGHVVIKRESDTLMADEVSYRTKQHVLQAKGHVVIKSDKASIQADEAIMNTNSKTGIMRKAVITLPGGERLTAERVRRIDDQTYEAEELFFSSCPIDQESWRIAAKKAVLDQQDGSLTASHARFELWQIPVLYSPWWQQPLRRKSGLLIPVIGTGKRRGTELTIPYYLAPAANWDATLTPRWMSARGFMGETELRHASAFGREQINVAGINDSVTGSNRGRLQGQIHWRLPANMHVDALADHVSDHDYLADYSSDADVSKRYLQSRATLSQFARFGAVEGDWALTARHQQDLTLASNATTLQILPRLETRLLWSALPNIKLHFDQQSTRFDRLAGVDGWRMDLHPYIEIPWQLAGGGITASLQAGVRHTRYWLTTSPAVKATPTRTTHEFSLEVRGDFERFDKQRRWRHSVSPVVRYDFIDAPNQAALPNFDSAFGSLTWSNLLSGNRFSGFDRIERTRRISLLVENRLQHKPDATSPARDVFILRTGASYDMHRESVDAAIQATPTRAISNLLAEVIWRPVSGVSFSGSGQYNPNARYWATLYSQISLSSASGHSLNASYQFTDARFSTESQLLDVSASLSIGGRWQATTNWQYDNILKLTQQTTAGLQYRHPCWLLGVVAFRLNRPSGTSSASDFGFRILLDFKGLGSVGS